MSLIKLVELPCIDDDRGSLVSLEAEKTIPFLIKRVYYIFGSQNSVSRGFHAHKNLQQVLICVSGRCRILLDDGTKKEDVWLDSPRKGLLINNMIWREMHNFSSDCVLLVIASEHYDESDYIREYENFLLKVKM